MEKLQTDELTISVIATHPGKLILEWRGKSTSRNPDKVLRPFFETILEKSKALKLTLELRFEKMEHFNSSTIAEVIQLINQARQREIPLSLYYDDKVKWQALSFDALRRAMQHFATDAKSPVLIIGTATA